MSLYKIFSYRFILLTKAERLELYYLIKNASKDERHKSELPLFNNLIKKMGFK